jgi:phosphate transport system substrate-binding protein
LGRKAGEKMKKIGLKVTTVALALGLAAAGISPAAASGALGGGGATFQADFQSKCLAKFNGDSARNSGIAVSYLGVGSGTGRTNLGNGSYKWAGTDSLGTKKDLTASDSVYFPVAAAPLVIMVKLNSASGAPITSALRLDAATLSNIFDGTITRWDNQAIRNLNPSLSLPDQAITVVARSDSSGSTGNLKAYLKQNVPGSKWVANNEDNSGFVSNKQTASGSPNLVAKVAEAAGRIGYADLSDVTASVVKVSLKNNYGQFIQPSATAASNYVKATGVLVEKSDSSITTNGGIYTVDFTKSVKDAYQLSFITYMLGKKSNNNTDLKVYANYVLKYCSQDPIAIGASGYTSIGATLIGKSITQVTKL